MMLQMEPENAVETLLGLVDGDIDLATLIDAIPAAIYTTDASGRINLYNKAAVELWGRTPDCGDERWCGSWRLFEIDGRRMRHDRCPMARALKSGKPSRGEKAVAERPDGSRVTFLAHPTPIRNAKGAIIGAVNMLLDITAQEAVESELKSRIEQVKTVSELGMLALASDRHETLFEQAVERLATALNVEFTKILEYRPASNDLIMRAGVGWPAGSVGEVTVDAGSDSQAGYTLSVNEPVIVDDLEIETRFHGPNLLLDNHVVSGISTVIGGRGKEPFGVLGVHTTARRSFTADDIHLLQSVANILTTAIERRTFESRQAVLQRELSHRVKNILSVIQAIARQTGQNAGDLDAFRCGFEKRLMSLSRTHDLLIEGGWSGASLGAVADTILANQIGAEQIELDIEDIRISPAGTQAVSMVFHELMTNAAKYGSLSTTGGVQCVGRHEGGKDGIYALIWRETGGPPVVPPTRLGYGSKLVETIIQIQFNGHLTVDWRPDGLIVTCRLPLSSIVE